MALQKLVRYLLNSQRVRILWQSGPGWYLIRLLPSQFRDGLKAAYRRVLVAPVIFPSIAQTHVDRWDGNKPILSVVIPCYNHGRFIRETVQSLEAETFTDFEIIVVDDASDDELTLRVLEDLRKGGIQVLRQKKLNAAAALNLGITAARGRYICCMGADDTLEPTYFEKALSLLESNPGVDFVYPIVRTFGDENRIWVTGPFDLRLLLEYNYIGAAAIIRKSVWEHVGGFDQTMQGYEDWDFWLKAGNAGYRGRLIPEVLINYRRHGATLNIRSDRKYQRLIDHIRTTHADIYAHPERTETIRSNYTNIRVPEPFANLSSKRQYKNCEQTESVILASELVPTKEAQRSLTALHMVDGTRFIFLASQPSSHRDQNSHSFPTPIYCLGDFLDDYCWLDFLVNITNTRSARSVVIWNSELAYEWTPAIKTRTSASVVSVVEDRRELIRLSARYDEYIRLHVAVSERVMHALVSEFGVSAHKVRLLPSSQTDDTLSSLATILSTQRRNQRSESS